MCLWTSEAWGSPTSVCGISIHFLQSAWKLEERPFLRCFMNASSACSYIYICGSVFHIWLSQNLKITWNDQFIKYGNEHISNLYESHCKMTLIYTKFIHDFGPQNETPRNHGIGLSARAVDPDLINHGNHGKGGKPIYTGIYIVGFVHKSMDTGWFGVHQTVHSTAN